MLHSGSVVCCGGATERGPAQKAPQLLELQAHRQAGGMAGVRGVHILRGLVEHGAVLMTQ